jgi:hypothetical protein
LKTIYLYTKLPITTVLWSIGTDVCIEVIIQEYLSLGKELKNTLEARARIAKKSKRLQLGKYWNGNLREMVNFIVKP